MADDYTPTTEQVRNDFATRMAPVRDGARRAAFDRWLAAHDRETAARAWERAIRAMRYEDGTPVDLVANVNPYREGDPT